MRRESIHNPLARTAGLVVQEVKDEILVYDLETSKACCLNSSAAAVWTLCDGGRSARDIARSLNVNDDIVCLALQEFSRHLLLENGVPRPSDSTRRRDVIRSLVMMAAVVPTITSLAAPVKALHTSCACTSNSQCLSCPDTPVCSNLGECVPASWSPPKKAASS